MTFRPKRFPTYYVPPGVTPPAHLFDRVGAPLLPDGGPEGRGGTIHHGPYLADTKAEYVATPGGWWVRLGHATPEHLLRAVPFPGVVIDGALSGHRWLVPVLLNLDQSVPDWLVVLAHGGDGLAWKPMAGLDDLIERVRAARLKLLDADSLESLAVDLLKLNHHIDLGELVAGGWLLKPMILDIVLAACSITPQMRAACE